MSNEPKPKLTGYSAAYRMKLEQEFEVAGRMHRLPRWMKETVSLMLKEIENNRALIDKLRKQAMKSESNADGELHPQYGEPGGPFR